MQTRRIRLEELVPHESSAVTTRIERLPDTTLPIIVKPIQSTQMFYIVDGTNRAYRAYQSGASDIEAVIGTPDFSNRLDRIAARRIAQDPHYPLSKLAVLQSDVERQHNFFLDTEAYSARPRLRSNRGTMIKLKVAVSYGESVEDLQFVLPQKGNIGAILLNPKAVNLFRADFLSELKISACWGNDKDYEPSVLPSYIELSNDGADCWAAGYAMRQSFRERASEINTSDIKARGSVSKIEVLVIYPNGLVYEGPLELGDLPLMITWSEEIVCNLKNQDLVNTYTPSPHWWQNPTSLIVSTSATGDCQIVSHTCGSTCSGGGCLV